MVDQIDVGRPPEEQAKTEEQEKTGSEGYSALPGLVRELIRTPGFKELLLLHLRDVNPGNARELVRGVMWEDVSFTMSVLGASPRLVNWLAEALAELGVQLNKFTVDILRDFMVQLGRDLDVEALRSIPGAYAPAVDELLLEDRQALDALIAGLGALADELMQALGSAARKVGSTADFGKIRVGLTGHLESRRLELEGDQEIFNPVVLSNLMGVVAPLANYLLRVLTRALQGLNLPAEILANAVFQLLEDIDPAELGGLVNALSDLLNTLHRGNLVLGREEPRFKAVLERVSEGIVANVDGERLKDALLALGEDGRVIGSVISSYVYSTPEATVQVVRGLYLAVGAALRTMAETFRRFAELPEEAVGAMIDGYEEAVDMRDLGRIVNYGAVYAGKMFEARPGEMSRHLGVFLASLDTGELTRAGKTAALEIMDAALADGAVAAALEPEAVGERINAGLAAFNRFSRENPELIADKLTRAVAAVDPGELFEAVGGLVTPLVKALAANRELVLRAVRPAARPLAAGALVVGGLAGGVMAVRRIRKRRRGVAR